MKGYRMVLLVNGILFLLVSIAVLFISNLLAKEAVHCRADPSAKPATCQQTDVVAVNIRRASPALAVVGIILLVLGVVLGRPKSPPSSDEL